MINVTVNDNVHNDNVAVTAYLKNISLKSSLKMYKKRHPKCKCSHLRHKADFSIKNKQIENFKQQAHISL